MDILTFVAAIAESLAWPAAVALMVFMLRRSLARLIPDLRRLKYKDLQVEFGRKVKEVRDELGPAPTAALPPQDKQKQLAPVAPVPSQVRYYQTLAEVSPLAAILEAWLEFELAANRATDALGLDPGNRPLSMKRLFDLLGQEGLLTDREVVALTRLRALRNRVVHGPDPELSTNIIAEYVAVLSQISADMDRRLRERSQPENGGGA